MAELAILVQKTCTHYTFRSLVYSMLPKDNLFKNIFTFLLYVCMLIVTVSPINGYASLEQRHGLVEASSACQYY